MPESPLRLVKRCAEYQAIDQIAFVPAKRRGLYVLYRKRRIKGKETYAVVYVGLATTSIRRRLASHRRTKGNSWTHFSIFEVWENIRDDEIVELEGLFRHFYKKDPRASHLNVQRGFKKIRWVRNNDLADWGDVE
jgi:hypothetical protein